MTVPLTMPVLLYDGLCGFCDRSIQFILARDQKKSMQFATLQGDYAAALFRRCPSLQHIDSLMLVPQSNADLDQVLVKGDAVIAIAGYLGGVWQVGGWLLRLVPRTVRDGMYSALARRRFKIFGRLDACRVPNEQQRARFLD